MIKAKSLQNRVLNQLKKGPSYNVFTRHGTFSDFAGSITTTTNLPANMNGA